MSKFKPTLLALLMTTFFVASAPAIANNDNVCQNKKWTGSYVSAVSLYGDNDFLNRWNFNSDGTLVAHGTAWYEDAQSAGTVTPILGSWECRADGKILMTYTYAQFSGNWALFRHITSTALVEIGADGTLTRIKAAFRLFPAGLGWDVSDPEAGFQVVNLNPRGWVLRRLQAPQSDIDALLN